MEQAYWGSPGLRSNQAVRERVCVGVALGDDVVDDVAVDVGEAEIAAAVSIGEFGMVEAQ